MKKIYLITAAAMFASSTAWASMTQQPAALPATAVERTEADITEQLRNLGYTDISETGMYGDVYKAEAHWNGKPVSVRINDADGIIQTTESKVEAIRSAPDATPEQLESELNRIGYTNVHDMTKAGDIYRSTAVRDGKTYRLRVDGESGTVTSYEDGTKPTIGYAENMSDSEIIDGLAELGYKNAHSVEREGTVISVKAMHDGEKVDLNIDEATGSVTSVN